MIRFFILFFFISVVMAHDEHLSVYGVAAPNRVLDPGYGFEMGTTIGHRTVLGLGMEYGSVQNNERPLSMRVDGRLLYSSELDTHWYPQLSAQWHVQDNDVSYWLGAGFQRQMVSELGLTAETLWQPYTQNFQLRLGLRVWIMRFRSLDSRVKNSAPQGAVYTGGARQVATQIVIDSATKPPEQDDTAQIVMTAEEPPQSEITAPDVIVVSESPLKTANEEPSPGFYVHLGIFRQRSSITELEQDARLIPYREDILVWYDPNKAAYRFLIGPYSQPRATIVKNRLQNVQIESFIYQKPKTTR